MSKQMKCSPGRRELLICVWLIALVIATLGTSAATNRIAQAAETGVQASTNTTTALPEIVVSATQLMLTPFEQPYAFYRYDHETLNTGTGRTALDRIDFGPGVIMQRTGPGQVSPYIRGLTGKQSLLLLDGIRLSHATMRGGPNQYYALIPDMSTDSFDAVLGSSSVVNGSDGLTGALDARLAPAGRGINRAVSPWVSTRIDSANGYQAAIGIDGATNGWRYSLEGSYSDFHDRVGGKDASDNIFGRTKNDKIPNTSYDQWSLAGRAAYDGLMDHAIETAFGHTRQNDAPRPDGYYENSGASSRISRYYDPETFTYLHLRDTWTPDGLFFDSLTTKIWWHQQDENQIREDLTGSKRYRRREVDDRIDSIGIEPHATSVIGNHELTYGVLALCERTDNAYREFRNPKSTGAAGANPYKRYNWSKNTTITDGAEYNTFALYAQDLWQINERWSLLSGLRTTYVNWSFGRAESHTEDLTGALRASYKLSENMMTFVGASKAFRAPNLDDLDGASDRASSGTITFGNPNLDPEVSYTGEAGWRYAHDRDQLAFSFFYTTIDDVIQRIYPTGGGNGAIANGERATLRGFELLWDYGLPIPGGFGNRLALIGSISLVDSEAKVPQPDGSMLQEPISRANRLYGLAGIRYDVTRNWWTKAQIRFHDAYGSGDVAAGDADDVRLTIPGRDDGTVPGFGVVDFACGWVNNAGDRWATLTLENLANKTYRQLGSGADASGLNIVLAGGMRF